VLAGRTGQAAEPFCDPGEPSHCAVEVQKGEKAPFTGQLLTPELALNLGQRAESCDARVRIEVSRTASVAAANKVADSRIAASDLLAMTRERDLERRLREESAPGLLEHPLVVSGLTAVLVILLVTASAKWAESVR
jgi:hypothetical protein